MYNDAWKQDYMKEKESDGVTVVAIKHSFGYSEPFEKLINKDICEFTKYEIINMMKNLNSFSINTLYQRFTIYREYTDWCIKKELLEMARITSMKYKEKT